jgi:hypothetical protein
MTERADYLNGVCQEVQFRAARKYLKQELSAHIDDKKTSLEAGGAADPEAEAAKAMGDPAETGRTLNAIHRPRMEWGVIVCVLLLSIVSIIVLLFSRNSSHLLNSKEPVLVKHFLGIVLGLGLMTALTFADYNWLVRFRHLCLSLSFLSILLFKLFGSPSPSEYYILACNMCAFSLWSALLESLYMIKGMEVWRYSRRAF